MTNGDRIRAMTDKELAEFLIYFDGLSCEHCIHEGHCNGKCIGGIKGWLRQPLCADMKGAAHDR